MQIGRLIAILSLLTVGFGALAGRLVYLQVVRHQELRAKAQQQAEHIVVESPPRGEIRGIRGNAFARTVETKRVCADPLLLGGVQKEVAQRLAPLLDMETEALFDMLQVRPLYRDGEMVTGSGGEIALDRFVVLKESVSLRVWNRVKKAMESLAAELEGSAGIEGEGSGGFSSDGVFAKAQRSRRYPHGKLASHVLGYVRHKTKKTPFGVRRSLVGVNGIEHVFDSFLSGVSGWRQTAAYPSQGEQPFFREQDVAAKPGMNVVLTLDLVLQELVEEELATGRKEYGAQSASAIMLRPKTGEILAMASLPSFDPNAPNKAPASHRRNRILTDPVEPGSTFKIVTIAAALDQGAVRMDDRFNCENGSFYYAGRNLSDHHGYDILTVKEILTKSSNIGTAKVAMDLGKRGLFRYIRRFGFGEQTGVPLPGEAPGKVHPVEDWSRLSITRVPMGHEVTVTPLQMTMAMAALANGGELMRPMLVKRVKNQEGEVVAEYHPHVRRPAVSEATSDKTVGALTQVVSSEGTARRADLARYEVAGKTGTAQKAGFDEKGNFRYLPGKYFASFIGFLPAEDPELCIAVTMDEPYPVYYGGLTAAPVFRRIASQAARYLNITPDNPDTNSVVAATFRGRAGTP